MKKTSLSKFVMINPDAIKRSYVHDEIEYIDISSVGSGHLVESPRLLPLKDAPSRAKRMVRDGDTILATVRPNLRSFMFIKEAKSNSVVSTGFAVLRAKSNADPRFIYYAVTDPRFTSYLTNNAKGTSYPAVDSETILRGEVPDYGLDRQSRIASVLSAYTDLIENNRRRIALLERAARLLYREWFVRLRFPGHEQARIEDGVPEGWERTTLGDIASANVESYKAKELPDEINYVDISSVSLGRIITKTKMRSSDSPGRARRKATSGDIIWSNVRPNLRAYALVLNPEYNDVFSTGFTVLTPVSVPFSYLYLLVTADEFVSHLVNHTTGASYPAVRPDDFKRANVLVPSKNVLILFHEKTEPIYMQVHALVREINALTKARDLLLPRLMNGEIPV